MKIYLLLSYLLLTLECNAGVTNWIDFELQRGHVKIPAMIAGINTYAILDTGSQLNAINKAFITKHDLTFDKGSKVSVRGAYSTENKTSYNNVPMSFFGMEVELDKVVEINLGYHTTGLLFGAGFFTKYVVQLDYPNKKMRLISQDSIDMTKFKNIEVQKQKGTGMPIVKVDLPNDKHLWLLLDTGNTGGMVVKRKVADKMGWLEGVDSQSEISAGVNAIIATERFRIPSVKFGPFELENVLVTIPAKGLNSNLESQFQQTGTRIKGKRVQGLIGYDVLKHFLITIDYKRGYAHIGLPEE